MEEESSEAESESKESAVEESKTQVQDLGAGPCHPVLCTDHA